MGLFDGGPESVALILIIIILLFGSEKLPELARGLGRAKVEFDRGRRMFMDEVREVGFPSGESATREHKVNESKIVMAAKDLGIETEGRTEEEIKSAILSELKSH